MHMQGEPRTMQLDPRYDDVAAEVAAFLEERLAFAVAHGVREERICLDPGIGFGKTVEHNVELLRRLDVLLALGRPLLIGVSRKSSLGKLAGDPQATTGPLGASVAAAVAAYERGATILRVHDVREHVDALAVARARARDERHGRAPRACALFGRHGVHAHEKENGQDFLFDVDLDVGERGSSDRLEDAVDYRDVARTVAGGLGRALLRSARGARDRGRGRAAAPLRRRTRGRARREAGGEARRPRRHRRRQRFAALTVRT